MPLLAVPQAGWPSLRGHRARTSDIEIDGAANMTWYSASPHAERGFCSTCGSHLFWKQSIKDYTGILAASFDEPSGLRMAKNIFVDDRGITTKSPVSGSYVVNTSENHSEVHGPHAAWRRSFAERINLAGATLDGRLAARYGLGLEQIRAASERFFHASRS
jgi:hypothetical protein